MRPDTFMEHFRRSRLPALVVTLQPRSGRRAVAGMEPSFDFRAWVARPGSEPEYFLIGISTREEVHVLDRDGRTRHLLLMVKRGDLKAKIIFGHDERHLFVCGVDPLAKHLRDALESLKPFEVQAAQARGARVVRQGEWFFIPEPELEIPFDWMILPKRPFLNGHTPDEWLVQPGGIGIFVRGHVRHRDHATIHLRCWHRVLSNRTVAVPGVHNWD